MFDARTAALLKRDWPKGETKREYKFVHSNDVLRYVGQAVSDQNPEPMIFDEYGDERRDLVSHKGSSRSPSQASESSKPILSNVVGPLNLGAKVYGVPISTWLKSATKKGDKWEGPVNGDRAVVKMHVDGHFVEEAEVFTSEGLLRNRMTVQSFVEFDGYKVPSSGSVESFVVVDGRSLPMVRHDLKLSDFTKEVSESDLQSPTLAPGSTITNRETGKHDYIDRDGSRKPISTPPNWFYPWNVFLSIFAIVAGALTLIVSVAVRRKRALCQTPPSPSEERGVAPTNHST